VCCCDTKNVFHCCRCLFSDLSLSDSGLYTCQARSPTGQAVWSASLTVLDKATGNIFEQKLSWTWTLEVALSYLIVLVISQLFLGLRLLPKNYTIQIPFGFWTRIRFSFSIQTNSQIGSKSEPWLIMNLLWFLFSFGLVQIVYHSNLSLWYGLHSDSFPRWSARIPVQAVLRQRHVHLGHRQVGEANQDRGIKTNGISGEILIFLITWLLLNFACLKTL
jgi:hypothetical protein